MFQVGVAELFMPPLEDFYILFLLSSELFIYNSY